MIIIAIILFCLIAIYLSRRNMGILIAFMVAGQQLIKFILAMFTPVGRSGLAGQLNLFLAMAAVGTVLFIITDVPRRVGKVFSKSAMLLPLALSAWLLLGLTYSHNSDYGLQKWLGFTMINIAPALFGALLLSRFNQMKSFILWVFIFSVGYAAALFIIMIIQGTNTLELRNTSIHLGETEFTGGIWLGRLVGISILSLFALPKAKVRFHFYLKLILGIFIFTLLLMAGSRGPALFVPIAVVGYLILHYGLRSIRTTLGIIAVGLCIAGILRWVPSPAIERIRENPFEKGKSGLVRIGNYNKAISSWQENEIWGLGTGGFGEYYPHNIFLEFGVENGIISVVIFATWIIVIIKKYFKLDRRYFLDEELRLIDWAFCAFIYGLLNAQVSGSLITNDWVWYGGIFCYRIVDLAREKALMEERRALLKPI